MIRYSSFGNFYIDSFQRKCTLNDRIPDHAWQRGVEQLKRRDIEIEGKLTFTGGCCLASLADKTGEKRVENAGDCGGRDEFRGRDRGGFGIVPSSKDFESVQRTTFKAEDGLENGKDPMLLDSGYNCVQRQKTIVRTPEAGLIQQQYYPFRRVAVYGDLFGDSGFPIWLGRMISATTSELF